MEEKSSKRKLPREHRHHLSLLNVSLIRKHVSKFATHLQMEHNNTTISIVLELNLLKHTGNVEEISLAMNTQRRESIQDGCR